MEKVLSMSDQGMPDRNIDKGYAPLTATDLPNDLAFLVDLRRRLRLDPGESRGRLARGEVKVNGPRGLAVVGRHACRLKLYRAEYNCEQAFLMPTNINFKVYWVN